MLFHILTNNCKSLLADLSHLFQHVLPVFPMMTILLGMEWDIMFYFPYCMMLSIAPCANHSLAYHLG